MKSLVAPAVLALMTSALVGSAGPGGGVPAPRPGQLTPVELARQTGRPMPVPQLGSATTRVFADPQGTFTAEIHARPAFVKAGDSWVPINLDLSKKDAGFAPVAAEDVAFSGGGHGPAVTLVRDDHSLALRWPGGLPAPAVAGAEAIYSEVAPGVDLVMRATPGGFAHTFVLKTPAAAQAKLRFAVDSTDASRLTAAPAYMWDSAGGAGRTPRRREPQPGDRIAAARLDLGGGTLAVVPDRSVLDDPATVYPVYVDAQSPGGLPEEAKRLHWLMTSEEKPEFGWWDTGWRARVGAVAVDATTTPKYFRSYFQQDISAVVGKHIVNATFRPWSLWSSTCTPRQIQVWETGAITPTTSWSTPPAMVRKVTEVNAAAGWSTGCPPSPVPMDVTNLVAGAAAAGRGEVTLGLRSAELDPLTAGASEFENDPALVVQYNTVPDPPSGLKVEQSGCGGYIATRHPVFSAWLDDADGPKGQQVAARFEWERQDGTVPGGLTTERFAPGAAFTGQVPEPEPLADGRYRFRVQADDGLEPGPWSPPCEFTVDTRPPAAAPGVSSPVYVEWVSGGQPFEPAPFTFDANGDTDVVGFHYSLDGSASLYVAAGAPGGTATVDIVPTRGGLVVLSVSGVDRAGLSGPADEFDLSVGYVSGPVAEWKLDDGAGTVASDSTGNHPARIFNSGGEFRFDGRQGGSLALSGHAHAATESPVVATDAAFTVMAWARLDRLDSWYSLLSQDGRYDPRFDLRYDPVSHRWVFVVRSQDIDGDSAGAMAKGTTMPQRGVWTHLAGVHDPGTGQIRLYVNGNLAGTAAFTGGLPASGPLLIGRAQNDGWQVQFWPGQIDEVQVYDRVASGYEIAHLAQADPHGPEGDWRLDEGTGMASEDRADSGNHLSTSETGVVWTDGRLGRALRFARAQAGSAYTAGPVLDTTKSFTVAAWVRPSTLDGTSVAVSQDGAELSAFTLGYTFDPHPGWMFHLRPADVLNPPGSTPVLAKLPAQLGEWTHLAGVYDAQRQEARLYVNGRPVGSAPHTTPWKAGGAFAIGRGLLDELEWKHWTGDIDEVHAVQRAATETEIGEWVKPAVFGHSGEWHLDGTAGLVDDSSPNSHRLQLRGGVTATTAGIRGGALHFDGNDGSFAHTAVSVAGMGRSFTVSAWVKLDRNDRYRHAVSQDGSVNSGFVLGYDKPADRLVFAMAKDEREAPQWVVAKAFSPPVLHAWTHLIGIYDAVRGEIKLLVNGQTAAIVPHRATWKAEGALILGRSKNSGWELDPWSGDIDEVEVLDHAASSSEISRLTGLPPLPGNGPVRVETTHSYMCLTEKDPDDTLRHVLQKDCRNQVSAFSLEPYADGSYRVYASHPLQGTGCLGVASGSVSAGARLQTSTGVCASNPDEADRRGQRVRLEGVGTPVAGFRLRFVHSNLCAAISGKSADDGAGAAQAACAAADPTQVFAFKDPNAPPPENGPPPPAPTGKVRLRAAHSQLCLGERVLTPNPAGWWRLTETGGSSVADSAGSNSGSATNVTWAADSTRGRVATFNGTSSQIDLPRGAADTARSFSIALRAKLSDKSRDRAVLTLPGENGSSALKLYYAAALDRWAAAFALGPAGQPVTWLELAAPAGVGTDTNTWVHLAVTVDAATRTARLYVNGTLGYSVTASLAFTNRATRTVIGAQYAAAWFAGSLSDVQAYQRTLTDAEVKSVYNTTDLNVYQTACLGAIPEYTLAKNGLYWTVQVKHPSFGAGCMGVYAANTTAGTRLRDAPCGSGDHTIFNLVPVSEPARGYRLKPTNSSLCVGIAAGSALEGAQAVQQACDPAVRSQVFVVEELSPPPPQPNPGVKRIRSVHSGRCLGEKMVITDVSIYQTACATANPKLTLEHVYADGTWVIRSSDPTRGTGCMGVQYASEGEWAEVANNYPCGNGMHQRFRFEPVAEPLAGFRIRPWHSDKCLTVDNASTADWAPVVQLSCSDTDRGQVFAFDDPPA